MRHNELDCLLELMELENILDQPLVSEVQENIEELMVLLRHSDRLTEQESIVH